MRSRSCQYWWRRNQIIRTSTNLLSEHRSSYSLNAKIRHKFHQQINFRTRNREELIKKASQFHWPEVKSKMWIKLWLAILKLIIIHLDCCQKTNSRRAPQIFRPSNSARQRWLSCNLVTFRAPQSQLRFLQKSKTIRVPCNYIQVPDHTKREIVFRKWTLLTKTC